MNGAALIVAWHGCDISVRDGLVRGDLKFRISENRYDWLGKGAYFFEDDRERAMRFAQASHDNPNRYYTAKPIAQPAVVGAILSVNRWLDMTTQAGMDVYREAHAVLGTSMDAKNQAMPRNVVADDADKTILHRHLDCAVFNIMHSTLASRVRPNVQAIRAAFYQGKELAPTSEFQDDTHIQIAVSDLSCIVGWFLPPSTKLLDEVDYQASKAALEEAKRVRTAAKRRVTPPASKAVGA